VTTDPIAVNRKVGVNSALWTLTTGLVLAAGLLVLNPFQWVRIVIIRCFAPGGSHAKIERLWRDVRTQDVSTGESPTKSLRELAAYWSASPGKMHVVLMGNSQTFSMILAPNESVEAQEERTYPDLVFAKMLASEVPAYGYRLSAPNISYMEALWYVRYLLLNPALKPDRLVLQLNYETFRKTGVRDGMLDLLDSPVFAAAIREDTAGTEAFSASFQNAIERYESRKARSAGAVGAKQSSKTGIAESFGFGGKLERSTRAKLARIPLWETRHDVKGTFLDMLYLLRVHVLRITPTTKRSIGGPTLEANRSALARIGQLCKENGVELALFNAPQNPTAPLYRTEDDIALYRRLTSETAAQYATAFYDFENSIPERYWGVWVDGPDPIHFGRGGHKLLANLMIERGVLSRSR
jgi:hypothetical protein